VEGAKDLAAIDGVTVLRLDVTEPASISSWADEVKAATDHIDVSRPDRSHYAWLWPSVVE
jgi:NAD(P)-dependent dehydrogenase (short-subunit alcohol dehydrogenase family)